MRLHVCAHTACVKSQVLLAGASERPRYGFLPPGTLTLPPRLLSLSLRRGRAALWLAYAFGTGIHKSKPQWVRLIGPATVTAKQRPQSRPVEAATKFRCLVQ